MSTDVNQGMGYVKGMQIARGTGILLVTLGHSEPVAQVFPLIWHVIYSFHMPLFFFMSGYFSLRLISRPWLTEVVPPALKLYLPYICISLSYGLIKLFAPGVKRPVVPGELLNNIALYPFDNPALFLWFLYILLLMKLLSPLFRVHGLLLLPLFLISACWYGDVELFGAWSLLKHLLYYYCGLLLAGQPALFTRLVQNRYMRLVALCIFPMLYLQSAGESQGLMPVLTALAGIWLVLSISFMDMPKKVVGWLEYCGKLSLEIYLLQYFFIFPTLMLLTHAGMKSHFIVIFTFIAGLLGPIFAKKLVLEKSTILSLMFTGRPKPKVSG